MAKSQETWNKKEVRTRKEKKRKDKAKKKVDRKANAKEGSSFDDMIAYVDENGMISSTPPDPDKKVEKIKAEDIVIGVPKRDDSAANDPIKKGIVSFFNEAKGFGFIKEPGKREGVFFHINNLIDTVQENNKVTFEVEMGQKGPVAVRVKLDKS